MKFKIKFLHILVLAALVTLTASCEKYFEGVNDNVNQPEEVTPDVLLPSIMVTLGYANQGDISRFTSMFVQQVTGATRQFATYQTYSVTETETNNWWRFNMYAGALMDLYVLSQQSEANGYTQYGACAKTLMAYGMMMVTDMMGDVPYTEAFQGADDLAPAYDSQESIYAAIQTMLDEAITAFGTAPAPVSPGGEDLLYGGDFAQWAKFANFLKARASLHLAKRNPANYTAALTAVDAAMTSSADDAVFFWGSTATSSGPWFQYIDQRDDIAYSGFIYDYMTAEGDPRYDVYLENGSLGSYFSRANAPFFFGSYAEQKFIEAEAAFQTSDLLRAANAHNAGVMASLDRYGVTDATFILNHASHSAVTITLEEIMNQKYVAMFLDPEAFTDWRRTGFPTLTAVPNNVTNGVIPRRLPYPISERLFNSGNFQNIAITTPVWWDVP